jgi:hypothetical protein
MYVRPMPETYTYLLSAEWPRADLAIGDGTWSADRFEFEDGDTSFVLTVPVLGSPGPWTDERTDHVLGQWLQGPADAPAVTSAKLRPTPGDLERSRPVREESDPGAHRQTLTITFTADREAFRAFAGAPLRALVDSALAGIGRAWIEDHKAVDRLVGDIRGEAIAW